MVSMVVTGWAVLALVLAALWARQLHTRDATSVDVAWSAGLLALSLYYAALSDGDAGRRALVGTLGALWSARLAWYLLADRVLRHSGEDGRYAAMRETLGARAPFVFFWFYQGQAAVAVLFSLPILAAMRGGPLLRDAVGVGVAGTAGAGVAASAIAGVLVWLIAVVGESVADAQLARFRAAPENRGRVCRRGLWRYSRHPNYFFEWLHWWSYVLIGGGAPLTWLGPVAMLVFLFRLTGIPYTERQALRSRGEAYRDYQRSTSVFVPWPPKGSA